MKNPGKIFTRDEIRERFNFHTDTGADTFLDMLAKEKVNGMEVMQLGDERVLVLQGELWEQLLDFMKSQGYWEE